MPTYHYPDTSLQFACSLPSLPSLPFICRFSAWVRSGESKHTGEEEMEPDVEALSFSICCFNLILADSASLLSL